MTAPKAVLTPRTFPPFSANRPAVRDKRVPRPVWGLPSRVVFANRVGPRYSQSELARQCGVVQSVISQLVSWKALYGMRLETLYKIAKALDVSVPWLLGESKTGGPKKKPRKASR